MKDDTMRPEACCLHSGGAYFDWAWSGIGFGQLSFDFDPATGRIECMNECMGRVRVRQLLHAMADYIADRAILLDNPGDVPPIDAEAEHTQRVAEAEEWEQERIARRAERRLRGGDV